MKKVAFIIQHLTNGGAERTISNLSMILQGRCEVYLIIFDGSNVSYPYAGKMIDLALPPRDSLRGKVLNVIRRTWAIRKLKKRHQFDCVISFMFGSNVVNALSGHVGKTVTSARNYMSVYGTGPIARFKEKYTAFKSDVVVSLSKMVGADLEHAFGVPAE